MTRLLARVVQLLLVPVVLAWDAGQAVWRGWGRVARGLDRGLDGVMWPFEWAAAGAAKLLRRMGRMLRRAAQLARIDVIAAACWRSITRVTAVVEAWMRRVATRIKYYVSTFADIVRRVFAPIARPVRRIARALRRHIVATFAVAARVLARVRARIRTAWLAARRTARNAWRRAAGRDDVDITTDRLLLRRWRESDLEPFAAMNADPRVMEHFPALMTREQSDAIVARFNLHFDERGYGLWALERRDTGAFIGFTGLAMLTYDAPFTPAVEIGWRLAPGAWGRGFATEAARAAVDHAFGPLKLDELVSVTVPGNVRSRAVMERIGMLRDTGGDFDHPNVPEGHPLRPHVLYRLRRG